MVNLIVARGKNGEIGAGNDLLWRLPSDMQFFKNTTVNQTVVMGMNTWKSIGEKPLTSRTNIVITRSGTSTRLINGQFVYFSTKEDMEDLVRNFAGEVFIIGGEKIYGEFASLVDVMYITEVEQTYENADTFFNEPEGEWRKTPIYRGYENGLAFTIRKWERIKNV